LFDDGFEWIPTHVRVAQDAAQQQRDERSRDVRAFRLDVPPASIRETLSLSRIRPIGVPEFPPCMARDLLFAVYFSVADPYPAPTQTTGSPRAEQGP
jgi:hypothetical protein